MEYGVRFGPVGVRAIGGTITLDYDGLDRLLSEATPNGTVEYTYDDLGRRLTMDVPGQAQISYAWDDADRLLTITQGSNVVTFDYDNANRRTKLTYPSGTSTEYAYDNASRLTGLTYKHGGNTLGALTYTYDLASQRTQVGGSWARTNRPNALASATYNAGEPPDSLRGPDPHLRPERQPEALRRFASQPEPSRVSRRARYVSTAMPTGAA